MRVLGRSTEQSRKERVAGNAVPRGCRLLRAAVPLLGPMCSCWRARPPGGSVPCLRPLLRRSRLLTVAISAPGPQPAAVRRCREVFLLAAALMGEIETSWAKPVLRAKRTSLFKHFFTLLRLLLCNLTRRSKEFSVCRRPHFSELNEISTVDDLSTVLKCHGPAELCLSSIMWKFTVF